MFLRVHQMKKQKQRLQQIITTLLRKRDNAEGLA
jgi:hypothetical protein